MTKKPKILDRALSLAIGDRVSFMGKKGAIVTSAKMNRQGSMVYRIGSNSDDAYREDLILQGRADANTLEMASMSQCRESYLGQESESFAVGDTVSFDGQDEDDDDGLILETTLNDGYIEYVVDIGKHTPETYDSSLLSLVKRATKSSLALVKKQLWSTDGTGPSIHKKVTLPQIMDAKVCQLNDDLFLVADRKSLNRIMNHWAKAHKTPQPLVLCKEVDSFTYPALVAIRCQVFGVLYVTGVHVGSLSTALVGQGYLDSDGTDDILRGFIGPDEDDEDSDSDSDQPKANPKLKAYFVTYRVRDSRSPEYEEAWHDERQMMYARSEDGIRAQLKLIHSERPMESISISGPCTL